MVFFEKQVTLDLAIYTKQFLMSKPIDLTRELNVYEVEEWIKWYHNHFHKYENQLKKWSSDAKI